MVPAQFAVGFQCLDDVKLPLWWDGWYRLVLGMHGDEKIMRY